MPIKKAYLIPWINGKDNTHAGYTIALFLEDCVELAIQEIQHGLAIQLLLKTYLGPLLPGGYVVCPYSHLPDHVRTTLETPGTTSTFIAGDWHPAMHTNLLPLQKL